MISERDLKMVQIAQRAAADWRALGGEVEDVGDGLKLCFSDDGPCVTISDSALRRAGRWLLAALRVLARKLGVGV